MTNVLAINGSPRRDKGNTAMILNPFLQGLTDAGAEIELYYASRLKIHPCTCGSMYCWYENPGKCSIQDDMQMLYPQLREAELLVLATPVYIPLPGDMQNFINRLCPLIYPCLEYRNGRTNARFHQDVHIKKIMLVSTGGWWEKENFDVVVRIVQGLAHTASVEYGGAVLRPHAFLMRRDGRITSEGETILNLIKKAGYELGVNCAMNPEDLEMISRPLISEPELRRMYNQDILQEDLAPH